MRHLHNPTNIIADGFGASPERGFPPDCLWENLAPLIDVVDGVVTFRRNLPANFWDMKEGQPPLHVSQRLDGIYTSLDEHPYLSAGIRVEPSDGELCVLNEFGEAWIVLEGALAVREAVETREARAGSLVLVPHNVPFGLCATKSTVAWMLLTEHERRQFLRDLPASAWAERPRIVRWTDFCGSWTDSESALVNDGSLQWRPYPGVDGLMYCPNSETPDGEPRVCFLATPPDTGAQFFYPLQRPGISVLVVYRGALFFGGEVIPPGGFLYLAPTATNYHLALEPGTLALLASV